MSNVQKFVLLILGIVALVGVVTVSVLRDRFVNRPDYQVSVVGRGTVDFVPDIANVSLGVTSFKFTTAQEAINDSNGKITKIIAAIKALGVKSEDIQTTNYSLQPQYDYSNNTTSITGYNVTQTVTVKVTGIDADANKVNQVLNAGTTNGANQVLGIVFDTSKLEDYKEQARLQAIASAKSKAGDLAKATGVRLGKAIGWWENVVQSPDNQGGYDSMATGKGGVGGGGGAGAPANVETGTMQVIIEVNLNYKVR